MADYHLQVQELRKNFRTGFTKDLKWRVDQLKSLLRMYEENEGLIVEALKKDLHKSKWETGKLLAKLSIINYIAADADIPHTGGPPYDPYDPPSPRKVIKVGRGP